MLCIDTTLAVSGTYTKQNERYIVPILLSLKFSRFRFQDKAKTLSINSTISLVEFANITLLSQCNALVMSIISSCIRKLVFFRRQRYEERKRKEGISPSYFLFSSKSQFSFLNPFCGSPHTVG